MQQGESSNHSHGKDCVEQEEVIHQGGKVTPKDACNMDPSGASDKVETPVLSQGTVQAMMVTALEWEDGPSCALFSEGTEDYEWMNQKVDIPVKHVQTPNASSSDVQNSIPSVPNFDNTPQVERPSNLPTATFDTAPKLPRANDIPGPVFDVSPISFKNASSDGPQGFFLLQNTSSFLSKSFLSAFPFCILIFLSVFCVVAMLCSSSGFARDNRGECCGQG